MRLSLVIPSFYPAVVYGGPIFATLHASEALAEEGIEVYVSTTNANRNSTLDIKTGIFLEQKKSLYVKYYKELIINRFSLHMLLLLWQDICKADVVHAQSIFSFPTPMALIYGKLFGKKILLSPRGSLCRWGLEEKSGFKEKWLRFLITPFVKGIQWHATSEEEKSDILIHYPDAKVHLITDGVNCEDYTPDKYLEKKEYIEKFCHKEILSVSKIIVSMGRLHKVKGFDILIKAFAKSRETNQNMILMIAGKDDGVKKELGHLIQELHLEEHVFLTGDLYNEDKVDFLANADLFVLPSHTENFGIVYAESLAAGTPIVASQNTPWSVVEQFDCGKWVFNSIEDTSLAINEMIVKDRALMRKNSKKLAELYDWKNIALQFKEVFGKIVEPK